jgi:hypothetical protein
LKSCSFSELVLDEGGFRVNHERFLFEVDLLIEGRLKDGATGLPLITNARIVKAEIASVRCDASLKPERI